VRRFQRALNHATSGEDFLERLRQEVELNDV